MLTIRSQVKELLKEAGTQNMSADFMDQLDKKVEQMILESVSRARENGRRTVMGKDL
jgi:histone H3/H4